VEKTVRVARAFWECENMAAFMVGRFTRVDEGDMF